MGYNSWYDLMFQLNEDNLRESVDDFVSAGFPAFGYNYFNLDDGWAAGRYEDGTLYANGDKFPSKTLKPLGDYVHSKGMKFGTYTDRGTLTCGKCPGALNHEKVDAQTYASWGIDYLKEDSCFASQDHDTAFQEYAKMRDALNATGRPILFSLCGWNPWYAPVGAGIGNIWRIGPDDSNWQGVLANINIDAQLAQYAGPGGFNDPCLLLSKDINSNLVMTEQQSRTQFNMWAILAAPLIISGNVRNMSKFTKQTYQNRDVIAVNQDRLGKQGIRIYGTNLTTNGSLVPSSGSFTNVWSRHLVDGWALAFINVGPKTAAVECDYQCLVRGGLVSNPSDRLCLVDLWSKGKSKKINVQDGITVNVPADGGSFMFKVNVC
eukprot:g3751.t1